MIPMLEPVFGSFALAAFVVGAHFQQAVDHAKPVGHRPADAAQQLAGLDLHDLERAQGTLAFVALQCVQPGDAGEFGPAERDRTHGRYTKSDGEVDFVALSAATLAASNAYPHVGPVVISEIMYHPPDVGATNSDEFEFLELITVMQTDPLLR